ncbi:hypothetical protein [Halostella sp. PRR32]|uniref:hypothetical protein n=1 Tax=Halostella sp. PRR32 TaxID=3098147 RepID=UPI002B1D23D7|nr:hypothetical protein [Halostella sp. PRR32]
MNDSTSTDKNSADSTQQKHSDTHSVDPKHFADVHQTPSGGVLFQDERESDAWLSSDVVQEVVR